MMIKKKKIRKSQMMTFLIYRKVLNLTNLFITKLTKL
jgi:hypothetical protein